MSGKKVMVCMSGGVDSSLTSFLLGFILAYLLGFTRQRRLKKTIRDLEVQQDRTKKELDSLRNLPLTEPHTAGERDQGMAGGD